MNALANHTLPQLGFAKVLRRSLLWHRRELLAIAASLAVAVAVLVGALVVGWSLQRSLTDHLLNRLADVRQVVAFASPMPADIVNRLTNAGITPITGTLQLRGVATSGDEAGEVALPVTIWGMLSDPAMADLGDGEAVINSSISRSLHIREGDDLILRADGSLLLPQSGIFTFATPAELTRSLRLRIKQVLPAGGRGDFSLTQSQTTPANVFLPLTTIAKAWARQPEISHLLLTQPIERSAFDKALASVATAADAKLAIQQTRQASFLQSPAVTLPDTVLAAAKQLVPSAGQITTYITREIASDTRRVSYGVIASQLSAAGKSLIPDGEVILNTAVAQDLHVQVGDSISLTLLIGKPDGTFADKCVKLRIASILSISESLFQQAVVTDLPGMADAPRIDAWKTPFPVDMSKVTARDEQYWDQYRATPKAIVSDALLQQCWRESGFTGTRAVTAIALPPGADIQPFARQLANHGEMATLLDLRQQAQLAGQGSSDFAGLFAGMSLFLVVAAILISISVICLAVDMRAREFGLVSILGTSTKQWRLTLLAEHAISAAVGIIVGIAAGILYAKGLLWLFGQLSANVWEMPPIVLDTRPATVAGVGVAVAAVVLFAAWHHSGKQFARPVRELLWGLPQSSITDKKNSPPAALEAQRHRGVSNVSMAPPCLCVSVVQLFLRYGIAILCCILAVVSVLMARYGIIIASSAGFFIAGVLLMLGLGAMMRAGLRGARRNADTGISLRQMCWWSVVADRRRAMLSWLVYAVAAFSLCGVAMYRFSQSDVDIATLSGPAGGLAYRITSPIALHLDLTTESGRQKAGMTDANAHWPADSARILALPASTGTEGGCLNLAKPAEMQVLGITPAFIQRGGFTITGTTTDQPWKLLEAPGDAIPVIGDAETMQWILHRAPGEVFTMPLGGKPAKLKLVGMLQGGLFSGQLLISEANFRKLLPDQTGNRVFFVEAGGSSQLKGFRDLDMTVEPTADILRAVHGVQQLYMALFLALGGLGLLLGSAGSVAVVIRDATQRLPELATLQAAGLTRWQCAQILFATHALPMAAGMASGTLSAIVAYLAISSPPCWRLSPCPWRPLSFPCPCC